jgi:hypothetical protein
MSSVLLDISRQTLRVSDWPVIRSGLPCLYGYEDRFNMFDRRAAHHPGRQVCSLLMLLHTAFRGEEMRHFSDMAGRVARSLEMDGYG